MGGARVTEAEVEGWLGAEPGGEVVVAAQLHPSEDPKLTNWGTAPVLAASWGAMAAVALGANGHALAALLLGAGLAAVSVWCARVARREAQQATDRYELTLACHGDRFTVARGEQDLVMPWASLRDIQYYDGPFPADTWPAAIGSSWLLSARPNGGTSLPGVTNVVEGSAYAHFRLTARDEATWRALQTVRQLVRARGQGRLLPGAPDPPDLSTPTGALSPAEPALPERDRGLSQADDQVSA